MTGNKIALDTNQAIRVLNQVPGEREWYQTFDGIVLPVVVLAELKFGAVNSGRPDHNLRQIGVLLPQCEVLEIRQSTTDHYASLRIALRRAGTPIPDNDLWIAASCVEHAVPLATSDAHFSFVPGLELMRR